MAATIKALTPDHLIASWNELMIVIFRKDTTVQGVQVAEKLLTHLSTSHPEGVLLLTIVEEQASMPNSAERAEVARLLENGTGKTRRSAVVYEGSGFRAAAVRSVVTGVTLFSRPAYPHKIFATVGEAALFFAEVPDRGSRLTARQITEAVSEVRQRYWKSLSA